MRASWHGTKGVWIDHIWPWVWLLCDHVVVDAQIAKFTGPTWGPPGSCQPQMGPMLVPWTLLSGGMYGIVTSAVNVWSTCLVYLMAVNVMYTICCDTCHQDCAHIPISMMVGNGARACAVIVNDASWHIRSAEKLKFGNGQVIHLTLYWACNYLFMLGMNLNHVSKRGPWDIDSSWHYF